MGNSLGITTREGLGAEYNLKLALPMLRVMGDMSRKLADKTDSKDNRYDYLTHVQTSAGILVRYLEEVGQQGDITPLESLINELADCLERFLDEHIVGGSGMSASDHPRLHAFRKITSERANKTCPTGLINLATLDSPHTWLELQQILSRLVDEVQSREDGGCAAEDIYSAMEPEEIHEETADFVSRLLQAVTCRCDINSNRELRLRIGVYKQGKTKPTPRSLCILLAHDESSSKWHELLIHDRIRNINRGNAGRLLVNTAFSKQNGTCVCSWADENTRSDHMRLHVDLDHTNNLCLSGEWDPDKRRFGLKWLQETNLKSLLSEGDRRWRELTKWVLAVILAYSLLNLYVESPIRRRWRRENIVFFGDGGRIPIQPFLRTSISRNYGEEADDMSLFHRYPELLELGTILLEIHLGKDLETFLGVGEEKITNASELWLCAIDAFNREKYEMISVKYRSAIYACLKPSSFLGNEQEASIKTLRAGLFQNIVRPLEEELANIFDGVLDPDDLENEAAEKCNIETSLSPVGQQFVTRSRLEQTRQEGVQGHKAFQHQPTDHHRSISTVNMQLSPEKYTVAWIAPLEIEAQAALKLLDHRHLGSFPVSRGDDYIFQAGDISGHNIIIATLPPGQEYGTGSAAALASQIKKKFPNLWFGLLVGVAAGLPDHSRTPARDIRLGDVLVGLPDGESAGLIAYDLGKETVDGFEPLRRGRVLASTESIVRSAIGVIKSYEPNEAEIFKSYYENIRDLEHASGTFADPGQDEDKLYEVGEDGSESLLERKPRPASKRTRVWYGPIGSGEKLFKNVQKRNELRDRYGVIGLEMEAAGTMNTIPVGVIRGVSDYGDHHKNKQWQPYAAAMAAAYAKAVLGEISPSKAQEYSP